MTFTIIAIVIGVTVILTQDFDHEKNESKIWIVVSALTQCSDPWDQDERTIHMSLADRITHYYEKHDMDIEIYDIVKKPTLENDERRCEGCDCSGGNLFLLVDESDVELMLNSGFITAEGNTTNKSISKNIKPLQLD